MTWTDRLKDDVPLADRAAFLTDLQAFVAALREERPPRVTDLLIAHADLALAYLDDGPKKARAQDILAGRKP